MLLALSVQVGNQGKRVCKVFYIWHIWHIEKYYWFMHLRHYFYC